jgi:hypothetical protein
MYPIDKTAKFSFAQNLHVDNGAGFRLKDRINTLIFSLVDKNTA